MHQYLIEKLLVILIFGITITSIVGLIQFLNPRLYLWGYKGWFKLQGKIYKYKTDFPSEEAMIKRIRLFGGLKFITNLIAVVIVTIILFQRPVVAQSGNFLSATKEIFK